jgi:hypothetical protein
VKISVLSLVLAYLGTVLAFTPSGGFIIQAMELEVCRSGVVSFCFISSFILQEIQQQSQDEFLSDRKEDEMEMSDSEDGESVPKKKKMDSSIGTSKLLKVLIFWSKILKSFVFSSSSSLGHVSIDCSLVAFFPVPCSLVPL